MEVVTLVKDYADNFKWESGVTPLSDIRVVFVLLAGYIGLSFLIQYLMKNRVAFKATGLVVVHNAGLCIVSLAMFLGTIYEIYTLVTTYYDDDKFHGAVCDAQNKAFSTTRFPFWSYIYYLSKYWEMMDTYILALKKKQLTFLQMYHHFIIVLLCWSWLEDGWTLHWVGITLNTLVHVFMYYYFSLAALGYSVWWKSYLTAGQLVQFSIVVTLMCYWYFVALKGLRLIDTAPFFTYDEDVCTGSHWVVTFSNLVSVSFLYLFGSFYVNNYIKKDKSAKPKTEKKAKKEQ